MANYLVTDTQLTSVANAIRAKTGSNAGMSFPDGMVSAVGSISAGSASTDGDVIFIDYDGTVVAQKTKAQINAMNSDSDLPANPTHTGLTAQGWNWTVAQLKAQLTAMPDQKVYVGQMYVTASGKTEIDVEMLEGRLSPIMTIAVNGTIEVDWGDNTTPDTVTGTSLTTPLQVGPHSYVGAGSYTIMIRVISGSFAFYSSGSYTLLGKNSTDNENRVYAICVKKIRIGTGVSNIGNAALYNCYSLASITIPNSVTSIGNSAFSNCYALSSITVPSSVTSIGHYAFQYCYSLTSITFPNNVTNITMNMFYNCYSLSSIRIPGGTSIGTYAFYNCSSLSNIIIPSSVTSIGNNAFSNCQTLSDVTIPSSVTSIGDSAFYNCSSLSSITIPNSVTKIGDSAFKNCQTLTSIIIPNSVTRIEGYAFQNCYGIKEYHILPTTVPAAGTTIFQNIPSDCVIYVPYSEDHSILESYKTASQWSTYASYMQEEPTT